MESPKNTNNTLEENEPQDAEMLCKSSSSSSSATDYDGISDDDVLISDLVGSNDTKKKPYEILTEDEIRNCQEVAIANICDILSIPRAEAAILLLHFNWDVKAVPEAWFSNGQKLREDLGLVEFSFDEAGSSSAKEITCGLCWGKFPPELVAGPACGHLFCNACWAGFFERSLQQKVPALLLRCPDRSCRAAVGQDLVNMLASDEDKERYAYLFMRSYIQYNLKANWCPSPGCKYALILLTGNNHPKVTCKCTYTFCWRCAKEAHQPIPCSTFCNWIMESVVQSENCKTITNSKGCPICWHSFKMTGPHKRMQCPSCQYHFCRVCRTSWIDNGVWDGDEFKHTCSKGKQKVEQESEENRAQYSLNKYRDTHSHWMKHEVDLQSTIQEILELNNGKLKALADKQGLTEAELGFYSEAWMQTADCKRVLKWTYVYEYYLPHSELDWKNLINFTLKCAEFVADQLYQCEDQMAKLFLNMVEPSAEFSEIRDRLCLKTSVARNYFDNMVWAIESKIRDLKTLEDMMVIRSLEHGINNAAVADTVVEGTPGETVKKNCDHCQFPKNNPAGFLCVMCYH